MTDQNSPFISLSELTEENIANMSPYVTGVMLKALRSQWDKAHMNTKSFHKDRKGLMMRIMIFIILAGICAFILYACLSVNTTSLQTTDEDYKISQNEYMVSGQVIVAGTTTPLMILSLIGMILALGMAGYTFLSQIYCIYQGKISKRSDIIAILQKREDAIKEKMVLLEAKYRNDYSDS